MILNSDLFLFNCIQSPLHCFIHRRLGLEIWYQGWKSDCLVSYYLNLILIHRSFILPFIYQSIIHPSFHLPIDHTSFFPFTNRSYILLSIYQSIIHPSFHLPIDHTSFFPFTNRSYILSSVYIHTNPLSIFTDLPIFLSLVPYTHRSFYPSFFIHTDHLSLLL